MENDDFYKIKDKSLKELENKIKKSNSQLCLLTKENANLELKYKNIVKFINKKKEYIENLLCESYKKRENILNEKRKEMEKTPEINGMQPSTAFINKLFSKSNENYLFISNQIHKLSPNLDLKLEAKTRTGANPISEKTFEWFRGEINEKERFCRRDLNKNVEVVKEDKERREKNRLFREERIRKRAQSAAEYQNYIRDYQEIKEEMNLRKKMKNLYEYEKSNSIRNELIE